MTASRSLAALLLAVTTGCVTTTPFLPGKPVEVKEVPLGHTYQQDGLPVRPYSLWDGLEVVEASREEARAGRAWVVGGTVTGSLGGLAIGFGIVDASRGKSSGWPLIAGGAALTAAGMWAGVVGDRHTSAAVGQYNATLKPAAPAVSWAPYLAPVGAPAGAAAASGVEAGITGRF